MKTWQILLIVLLCFLFSALTAHADEAVELKSINTTDSYYFKNSTKLRVYAKSSYCIQQGSATDGEYGYFLLMSNLKGDCSILKVNLEDYQIIQEVVGLSVDHGNGMAYNSKTNQFVVAHCKPNGTRLSFIDRDTLTITGFVEMPMVVISITYNERYDQYVVVHNKDRQFSILDNQFQILHTYDLAEDMFSNQDIDCDDQYIYLLQWVNNKGSNENHIGVYDWDGNYINRISVRSLNEIESMFHIDNQIVLAFYAGRPIINEGQLFRVEK